MRRQFSPHVYSSGPLVRSPQSKKLADGVYVHAGRGFESNSGIIRAVRSVISTSTPVRLVIDTEPLGLNEAKRRRREERQRPLSEGRQLYSALIFAARITLAHFSVWRRGR